MIPRERLPQVASVLGLPAGLEQQLGIGAVQPQPMQAPAAPAPVLAAPPAPPRPAPVGPLPPGAPTMSTDPMAGGESPLPPAAPAAPPPQAPPPPELQYRPGSYSPGGWRGDSRSTTGVAGQAPLIEAYDAATADAVRANARAVEAQTAIALREQAAGDALRDVQQQRAEALAAREQDRQAKLDAAQAHVDEQVTRFEKAGEDDPLADDVTPLVLGIGQALANVGRIIRGGHGDYDFVQPYINRKIAQQRASLAKMGSNIESAKGVVADMRKRGFEQADAEKLAESVYYQRAALEAEKRLAGIREPAKRAAAGQMVAQYNQKALENRLEVGAKYGEKYQAAEKYAPGSSSGGSYLLNGVPVKSIGEALQLKKLMGTDSETQLAQRGLDIKAAEAGLGGGGEVLDKRTVLDPEGRPLKFPSEKQAQMYEEKYNATEQIKSAVKMLRDNDAEFKAGKIDAYTAQQRAEGIMGVVRPQVHFGLRSRTDSLVKGNEDELERNYPTPGYTGGVTGVMRGLGDLAAGGVDRNEVSIKNLEIAAAQAAQQAADLGNKRGVVVPQRDTRGKPALDLKPRQ